MRQNFFIALVFIFASPTLNQHVLTNIPFECKGRLDGFWRDLRYCDVFHACIAGEHKRSYGCPQFGEKFYFDEKAQICDFAFNKTGVCETNDYYTSIATVPALPGRQPGAKSSLSSSLYRIIRTIPSALIYLSTVLLSGNVPNHHANVGISTLSDLSIELLPDWVEQNSVTTAPLSQ
ncbi:unnamed protein product [Rotaria socialis]|uniref:Chitin-binding type-2 domain-containing protein n=1 Tax=Rotaria socialis TaxID=392032 RepID=A0A821AAT4_9BILA|nr:unnamed protein product [Rotaria socialis]CAF4577688.1 unnamed protein product [Rotaria socialis]CAF4612333.1 unnamed protein product [Rotaria socialis]CAF4841294.1 unnamed protein product [Rotaria socialis]